MILIELALIFSPFLTSKRGSKVKTQKVSHEESTPPFIIEKTKPAYIKTYFPCLYHLIYGYFSLSHPIVVKPTFFNITIFIYFVLICRSDVHIGSSRNRDVTHAGRGWGVPPRSSSTLPQMLPVPIPDPYCGGLFPPIPIPHFPIGPCGASAVINFFLVKRTTKN